MEVYVVMVLNEAYLKGARLVAAQLRHLDPLRAVWCLAAEDLNTLTRAQLESWFDGVHYVAPIDSELNAELRLLNRPDLRMAVTKLRLWELDFEKIVYVDADTLPLQSLAALFSIDLLDTFSVGASPDSGWPDTFNSGVMVLRPDRLVFDRLLTHLNDRGSFDGADQGVLNEVLRWVRLPFAYNVTINAAYEYEPAYNRFARDVLLLHFIGANKPWNSEKNANKFVSMWWDAYAQMEGANQPKPGGSNKTITSSHSMSDLSAQTTKAISQALTAAESTSCAVDESRIIAPPPDYWDAKSHEPFKSTAKPPAHIPIDALALAPTTVHVFPQFGPSLVKLPFESEQKPAERVF